MTQKEIDEIAEAISTVGRRKLNVLLGKIGGSTQKKINFTVNVITQPGTLNNHASLIVNEEDDKINISVPILPHEIAWFRAGKFRNTEKIIHRIRDAQLN